MDLQHFLEVGYVDVGYFSPELSSCDTYPDYIRDEAEACVERIQACQSRDSVSFGFMTDIHYSDTFNHNIRTERLLNAYQEIASRVGVDRLILGGDYVNDGCKAYKVRNYRELRAHLRGLDYYPVNGNHDDNSIWDEINPQAKATQHLTAEELYTLFYNHLVSKGARFPKEQPGLYYYVDDGRLKVRYIFLDTNDIPIRFDEKERFVYTKQHTFAVSQKQLDWLVGEALLVEDEDWGIVIVSHTLLRPSRLDQPEREEEKYLGVINQVLDAYKQGVKISDTWNQGDFELHLDVDFAGKNKGTVIGAFLGHYHMDFVEYTEAGIPFMYVGNVIMYKTKMPRLDGDKSELLFDIVTIDRRKRKIHLTRVGAGKDAMADY